ncbi:MAG TPA: hypothetical protein DHV62_05330 [Elusimicrobia bacterium]|nr:hypothetical protein [Elusimicrobiota bacterium]
MPRIAPLKGVTVTPLLSCESKKGGNARGDLIPIGSTEQSKITFLCEGSPPVIFRGTATKGGKDDART